MSFKLSIGKTAITAEDMYSNEAIMAFHDKHVVDILPEYLFYMFKFKLPPIKLQRKFVEFYNQVNKSKVVA